MDTVNIREAARLSGLTVKALRYYEQQGLVLPVPRTQAGYRVYDGKVLKELHFIKKATELGFSLAECGELLDLYRNTERKSADVRRLVTGKIQLINARIRQLGAIRRSLEELAACCPGDAGADCPVLDALSETQ